MEEKYTTDLTLESDEYQEDIPEENQSDVISQIAEQERRQKKSSFGFFTAQLAVCIVLVTVVLFVKLFLPGAYTAFCEQYGTAVKSDESIFDIEQVKETLSNIIDGIKPMSRDESEQNSSSEDESKEEVSSESKDEASEEGAGGEQNSVSGTLPDDATLEVIAFSGTLTTPVQGNLTSAFGYRKYPLNGEPDFHKGIDIQADEGTKILAAYGGKITAAKYSESLGYYIVIDHENGFSTTYGHCKKLLAEQGNTVNAGDVIATVGSTGASTGNHLHFAIKYNGLWIDPLYSFPENTYAAI